MARETLWRGWALFVVVACVLLPAGGAAAQQGTVVRIKPSGKEEPILTQPGELPKMVLAADASKTLPLKHTTVHARVTGYVADVEVAQTFSNEATAPIEVRYIFPLPQNSAVDDMRMVIGERVVRAEIQTRADAAATYARAKRAGRTAALLKQERSNVFTQSVANIAPGQQIDVVVHYLQDLTYDAGQYELVFPMVVGPRFSPPGVKDAARISPSYLGKGDRPGDISLDVALDAGGPIASFEVPTHEVSVETKQDGRIKVALAELNAIPNRDFVLRWRVDGKEPRASLFTGTDKSGTYFSLVIHPPVLDVESLVGKRELTFVVDVSGSMFGEPLALCKAAMREALVHVRPVDTFNVLTFASGSRRLWDHAVPATRENIASAAAFVDGLSAGGGTMMADAVAAALEPTVEAGRRRYVFFLTDGYVGNEDQIIATAGKFVSDLEGKGQTARVFAFGVGSSTNHMLIDGLAKGGKGLGVYASNREDPRRAVNQYFHYIDSAVLSEVHVDWKAIGASDVMPAELPDLFASHALIVHGKITGAPSSFDVTASANGQAVTIPVTVRPSLSGAAGAQADTPMPLGTLWAREKIQWFEETLYKGEDQGTVAAITKLGLEHHLVTRHTSLVAVDTLSNVGDGHPRLVEQPVAAPEGVDLRAAGGKEYGYSLDTSDAGASPPSPPATESGEKRMEQAPDEGYAMHDQPSAPPPSVRRSRACGCRTVGAPDSGSLGWLASLTAIAVVVARRRRSS